MGKRRPWQDEWKDMRRQERGYIRKYRKNISAVPNRFLSEKIPDGLSDTLEKAFVKAFEVVFTRGSGIIGKMIAKDRIEGKFSFNQRNAEDNGDCVSLRAFGHDARSSGNINLIFSGVEGLGLGVLGIGLPDIPLFTAALLKSIYEVALHYGYSYDTEKERIFILRIIWAALSYGDMLADRDEDVNRIIKAGTDMPEIECISCAAAALSEELLYMKFVQGLPLVGAVGGAYDMICMRKVLRYAGNKYRRRYLYEHAEEYLLQ